MRRTAERVEAEGPTRIFLMNVPATWRTKNALALYDAELGRLGAAIERLGGSVPDNSRLADEMLRWETRREREVAAKVARVASGQGGIPVAVVGGPLTDIDRDMIAILERAGGRVVLDGTEGGERTLPAKFDRRRIRDDARGVLVESYFGAIPDAFRRDDQLLYDWVRRTVPDSGARGVVVLRYLWCDMWAVHAERIGHVTGLPVLEIDLTNDSAQTARLSGRLEAFLEMLS
jgi:benzoyl-CoA reductase/2-hydroxyglutaryl-CoA dehydratase subunit BcrC/BadD/HgdB